MKEGDFTSVVIIGISYRPEAEGSDDVVTKLCQPLVDANIPFSVPESLVEGRDGALVILVAKEHGDTAAKLLHENFVVGPKLIKQQAEQAEQSGRQANN